MAVYAALVFGGLQFLRLGVLQNDFNFCVVTVLQADFFVAAALG